MGINDKNYVSEGATILNTNEEVLKNYEKKKEYNFYKDIKKISESKRLEIFRRLNSTQHGTINLVRLREKLLELLDKHPNFQKIDLLDANIQKAINFN